MKKHPRPEQMNRASAYNSYYGNDGETQQDTSKTLKSRLATGTKAESTSAIRAFVDRAQSGVEGVRSVLYKRAYKKDAGTRQPGINRNQ